MLHGGGGGSPFSNVKEMAIGKKKKKKEKKITPWTEQNPKVLWTKSFLSCPQLRGNEKEYSLGVCGDCLWTSLSTHRISLHHYRSANFFMNLNRL